MKYCPKCGTEYREGFNKCADCDVSLVDNQPNLKKPQEKYGSLSKRIASTVIDSLILVIPFLIFWFSGGARFLDSLLSQLVSDSPEEKMQLIRINLIYLLFYSSISLCYSTFFIGRNGSTLGQKIAGLKVATEKGEKLDYKEAFSRAAAYLIYYLPFIGGLIMLISAGMISSSVKRQAIHDKICKNVVLNIQ